MDWSNERYVRLYIRDTTTWKILGWDGQCLLMQLLRKVDRCGFLSLDGLEPWEGAALHTGAPEEAAKRGVEVLLRKGVMEHRGQSLVFPNYLAAQECVKSDALRAKEYRERRLVTDSDDSSREVTHESRNVSQPSRSDRERHAASRGVTPNQPRHAEPATPGGAGGDAPDGAAPLAPPAPKKTRKPDDAKLALRNALREIFRATGDAAPSVSGKPEADAAKRLREFVELGHAPDLETAAASLVAACRRDRGARWPWCLTTASIAPAGRQYSPGALDHASAIRERQERGELI